MGGREVFNVSRRGSLSLPIPKHVHIYTTTVYIPLSRLSVVSFQIQYSLLLTDVTTKHIDGVRAVVIGVAAILPTGRSYPTTNSRRFKKRGNDYAILSIATVPVTYYREYNNLKHSRKVMVCAHL